MTNVPRMALTAIVLARVVVAEPFIHTDEVYLTVPSTNNLVTVEENGVVHAYWDHHGVWQHLTLERKNGAGDVVAGETVYFKAWTGKYLSATGDTLTANALSPGRKEKFTLELSGGGSGPITPGSSVVIRSESGRKKPIFVAQDGSMGVGGRDGTALLIQMAPHLTTTSADAPTTPEPTTVADTTAPAETTTEAETTTAAPATTAAPTPSPTTTAAPATTAAPTPSPTTTAGGPAPMCKDLDASGIAAAISVKPIQLPGALMGSCPGWGTGNSCRHGYYAASPVNSGEHALLYNDAGGNSVLVLFDQGGDILQSKVIGNKKVRGLQFEPDAGHLVALLCGGTNIWLSPSYFVKMKMPTLEVVWTKPIESPLVGLEKWTPDNTDAIAVSHNRYVLNSAGYCRDGKWCAGHQGNMMAALDAATGSLKTGEAKDWRVSHSCKQMIGYDNVTDTFVYANAGDMYPKALQFNGFRNGGHLGGQLQFTTWGDGTGPQGMTQGAIKGNPYGGGFASVWSVGPKTGAPDKLYFATITKDVAWGTSPKEVFPSSSGTELGANIAPLADGLWLVAYTEASGDLIGDYTKIFWDNWGIPGDVRLGGSRMAVLDSSGSVVHGPVDVSALGAPFPVEVNHLVERPDGFGWIYLDGPGKDTAKLVHLKCRRS